uniref:Uncharacterized protein n=1 Tax=Mycobacterium leprae TaxID=1769 RepID=O07702_MYCLR|nr:hypothetical protein MLCL383.28c [Mycobacterium leprae]
MLTDNDRQPIDEHQQNMRHPGTSRINFDTNQSSELFKRAIIADRVLNRFRACSRGHTTGPLHGLSKWLLIDTHTIRRVAAVRNPGDPAGRDDFPQNIPQPHQAAVAPWVGAPLDRGRCATRPGLASAANNQPQSHTDCQTRSGC